MNKYLALIITLLIISNCTIKQSVEHHGVHMLETKNTKLKVNIDNKNDIINLLGPPILESSFDNNILFYIERKISTGNLYQLGKRRIKVNNVLVVEVDNRGILVKKDFYNLNDMNDINLVTNVTEVDYQKTSFVYDFLSSMRQKINDPLGKRQKK
jgi:outer membrane protein assembly factor BamE (lipoprotein component of BamABCDE complex)